MIVGLGNTTEIIEMIQVSLGLRKGSFFQRPDMGSDLHLLKKEKDDDQTMNSIPGRIKKALQWMLTASIITDLSTTVTRVRPGMIMAITIASYRGKPIKVENFYPVGVPKL